MKRFLLRNVSLIARNCRLPPPTSNSSPNHSLLRLGASTRSWLVLRLFSSDNGSSNDNPNTEAVPDLTQLQKNAASVELQDVSNKELKIRIEKYFAGDEEALPSILEAILQRKLSGKHAETDDELMEELETKPSTDVTNKEFEDAFEETHETDEEIDDLYDAKGYVLKKFKEDEFSTMDDKKWTELVEDGIKHGFIKDTKECAEILEDMLNWDKLLPDDIKKKVEERFNELGDMCERGELEPEEAYKLFKGFEDKLVEDYVQKMEAKDPEKFDESDLIVQKEDSDVLQRGGPSLRWKTRVVIGPGGNSWHPKNRLVKLGVTVKELGLSKYQFRRLRELVGKRYHPGKDELLITSERFEHREENRKDCLRTLLSLIEEAKKANDLVDDARAAYVKGRLRENPAFMERLRAKALRLREWNTLSA